MNPVAGKNWNVYAAYNLPRSVGVGRRNTDVSKIRIQVKRRITSGRGRSTGEFRAAKLGESRLEVSSAVVGALAGKRRGAKGTTPGTALSRSARTPVPAEAR